MFRLLLIISVALALIIGLSKLTNREAVVTEVLEDAAETLGEQVENAADAAEDLVNGDEPPAIEEEPEETLGDALADDVDDVQSSLEEAAQATGEELESIADTAGDSIEAAAEEGEAAINDLAEDANEVVTEASEEVAEDIDDAVEASTDEGENSAPDEEDPS